MYYLIVKNLGKERCIDKNESDIYTDNDTFDCQNSLEFNINYSEVRKIKILCIEYPGRRIIAKVCSD